MLFSATTMCAQQKGNDKLYIYKQAGIPGVQRGIAEEGTSQPRMDVTQSGYSYHIFVQSASRIYPIAMWINGEELATKPSRVETPVTFTASAGLKEEKLELVPATKEMVWRIDPAGNAISGKAPGVSRMVKQNAFVLAYKKNGVFYYLATDEIAEIPAMVGQ